MVTDDLDKLIEEKKFKEAYSLVDRSLSFEETDLKKKLYLLKRKAYLLSVFDRDDGDACVIFGILDTKKECLLVYDEIINLFTETKESVQGQEIILQTFLNKARVLGDLNRYEEALAAYNELIRKFFDSQERKELVQALEEKGDILRSINRREDAITVYKEIVNRFATAQDRSIKEQVERVLRKVTCILLGLGRYKQAYALWFSRDPPQQYNIFCLNLKSNLVSDLDNKMNHLLRLKSSCSEELSNVLEEIRNILKNSFL